MKLKFIVLAALFLCLAGQAHAQRGSVPNYDVPDSGFFYFAPEVLGFFPNSNHIKGSTFVAGRVGYQISPDLAAEIETGWVRFEMKNDLGRMNTEPLMANARYGFMGADSPWDVFLMGGIGVAFNRLNTDVPGVSSSNTFAIQTGTGLEWRFNPSLSVVLDLRYYWNDPDIDYPGNVGSVRTHSFGVGGGLCWSFR